MSKLFSLHIGMNHVDPDKYPKHDWSLSGPQVDVPHMAEIAERYGVQTPIVKYDVTADELQALFKDLQARASPGDLVFFTYSGHGGWVPDKSGDEIKNNERVVGRALWGAYDQTILLMDRMFVDDEFQSIWRDFKPGVRILTMFDSCESGSPIQFQATVLDKVTGRGEALLRAPQPKFRSVHGVRVPTRSAQRKKRRKGRIRTADQEIIKAIYYWNVPFYDSKQQDVVDQIQVVGLHFGACRDDQSADEELDGSGGYFTNAVYRLLASERPPKTYKEFYKAVRKALGGEQQTPTWMTFGTASDAILEEPLFTTGCVPEKFLRPPRRLKRGGATR